MTEQHRSDHFFRATMRHFAELRNARPRDVAGAAPFPKDWFDLPPEFLRDFGAVFYLTSLTQYHRGRSLADLFAVIEPPLRLGQYRIFRADGFPRAAITWAGLSEDAERRFAVEHQPLQGPDWNSGASTWLVDFIAPFGHVDEIVPMLSQNPNLRHVRTLWHNKAGTNYRIVEWSRPEPEAEIAVKSYGAGQFKRLLDGEDGDGRA